VKAVVIGAGIIGSSVAWRLASEGAAVTMLERGRAGHEASWAAAGMIAPQAEAQGPGPFFDLCIRAREAFVATVERLRAESGIDPEYDDAGILYVAFDGAERAELEERARWQKAAGGEVYELSGEEARRLEPGLSSEVIYATHLPRDRRTDNRQLTRAFAAAAIAKGATLNEGVRVEQIVARGDRAAAVRLTEGVELPADVIINAAGAWAGEIRGLEIDCVATYPVRGQMLCFEGLKPLQGPSIFSLHGYIVPRRDGRLIVGSTMEEAGYDKRVTLAGVEKIARGAMKMMPTLSEQPWREAWAGLRPATRDFLPVIGPSPSLPNVFYATGHFRSGILLSALTGELIADLVAGREPAIDLKAFTPARFAAKRQTKVLGLVRDILFRSKIDAVAQVLGIEVAYASTLEQALKRRAELNPTIVFADLSDANFPPAATAAAIKGDDAQVRLIGFASHVDLKPLAAAREAGFDQTLSRSEFTSRLADLVG
jgi:glycine oxidase